MNDKQRDALMEVRRGLLTVLDGLEQWLEIAPTTKDARRWIKGRYSPSGFVPIEAAEIEDKIDQLEEL